MFSKMSRYSSRTRSRFLLGFIFGVLFCKFLSKVSPKSSDIQKIQLENVTFSNNELFENKLSDELYDKVKVLCWIMISPKFHKTRGVVIKNTWGRRCNKLLFMSSEHDPEINSIALPDMKEKKSHLWTKTKKSFQLIHDEYLKDYDWILKADDDTFMVMENVREMLYQYRPETALYFGQRMIGNVSIDGFMQGGAYILSKKAVQKFVKLYKNCRKKDGWAEDLYMGGFV
jgi:glycoprotein-N-acetylgalactosamine 3-beta-galactosyltransferase